LQMQAVSISIAQQIPAGVVLVKAVSLLQLPMAMLFGRMVLKERISPRRAVGSLVMLAGAVIIVLGRS
ncbi:MAG TPA: EamA family transporter, partial [Spirochaetota bacterium]|nr:EamA family transporter [Spirochaetota bacterium]